MNRIAFYLLPCFLLVLLFYKSIFITKNYSTESSDLIIGKKKFDKLIYFVIDGLRFDGFVEVNKNGKYFNNFTFTSDPSVKKNVFLSIAGIPTCTKCRVLSLMTGIPSNQIEELKAFVHSEIKIDNLFSSLNTEDFFFYGDDCWVDLFPKIKCVSKTINSYSKDSLDENEVNLFKDLINRLKNKTCPKYIFAHFIALDSHGHTYGTDNNVIKDTMIRYNDYLNQIYSNMDENALLVVLSDHGVTDSGAHGGNSEQELSSVCGFFYKGNKIEENDLMSYNTAFIEKFFNKSEDDDWIKAKLPYKIIHQDDILITLCSLLELPIPLNAYGNVIPYISRDRNSLISLVKQKSRILNQELFFFENKNLAELEELNYTITKSIHSQSEEKNPLLASICLILSLILLLSVLIKLHNIKHLLHVLFTIIMVSHSYRCFASEDFFWWITFLLENYSFSNILAFIFYEKLSGNLFFEKDRIGLKKIFKIGLFNKFENNSEVILFFIFFLTAKTIEIRSFLPFRIQFNIFYWSQIKKKLILVFNCFIYPKSRVSKLTLFSVHPTLDTLLLIHFDKYQALFLIFIAPHLDSSFSSTSKFSILSLLPYFINLEKIIQTIDYNKFFVLSNSNDIISTFISCISYFFLLRWIIASQYNVILRKTEGYQKSLFLNIIGIKICFICSWFMQNSLVFTYFFVSRLFFITVYFLHDILFDCITEIFYDIKY